MNKKQLSGFFASLLAFLAVAPGCSLAVRAELLAPLNKSGRTETSEPAQPKPLPTPPPAATPSPTLALCLDADGLTVVVCKDLR